MIGRALRAMRIWGTVAVAAACGAFCYLLARAPRFAPGEGYELYFGASSSAPMASVCDPLLGKLFCATAGESVRYRGDCRRQIAERFRARLLFCEKTGDVTHYYLWSPMLGQGVSVNGVAVNLHIAADKTHTAVGTPLIFGGS